MTPMKISATAMNTTRSVDGGLFQPMRLVSGPGQSFASVLTGLQSPTGVQVMSVEPTGDAPRVSYDPTHPDADGNGFVTYPGVDHAREMTGLVMTARVYEANLAAFGIAQQMAARALELGRSQ